MGHGIFIVGTDTEIGKTYVCALMCKYLKEHKLKVAYYKAAASGEGEFIKSDAGFVKSFANLTQDRSTMLSYIYQEPLSPHLAGRINHNFVKLDKVQKDFNQVCLEHDVTVVEGSGGIICPITYEKDEKIILTDLIYALKLDTILVARAGLGTINHTILTVHYLKTLGIKVKGIILNSYEEQNLMHQDNRFMIEDLTQIKVIATVHKNDKELMPNCDLINLIYN